MWDLNTGVGKVFTLGLKEDEHEQQRNLREPLSEDLRQYVTAAVLKILNEAADPRGRSTTSKDDAMYVGDKLTFISCSKGRRRSFTA